MLAPAALAKTVDLKAVPRGSVAVPAADFFFQAGQLGGKKFHPGAALGADDVMATATVVRVLVAGNAAREGDLTGQATGGEQLQCAIHGGEADPRIARPHALMQFLGGEALAGFQETAEDGVALLVGLQPRAPQVLVKELLRAAQSLPRDRALTVDPLLNHGELQSGRHCRTAGAQIQTRFGKRGQRLSKLKLARRIPFLVTDTSSTRRKPYVLRRWARRLSVALLVLGLAGLGFAAWFYYAATASLPQLDGTLAVAGLSSRVTVLRDAQGVPHITAASLDDLFFAQGYVTAQDRLWQMDMARRYAAGEMSEVLGVSFLAHDREQRILQIRHAAHAAAAVIPEREREFLEAYARGVNALMESQRDRLPIEFLVLRYQPLPWTVEDSLLVGANMSKMLNYYQVATELGREMVLAKVGAELAADLYPEASPGDRPFGPQLPQSLAPASREQMRPPGARTMAESPVGVAEAGLVPGSNNWVVSGVHTVSGKPLLSNDMHLPHQIPNIWYEAHLTAGAYDVAGVTLPGVPFVIVGHNRRIAWGFTNLGPDVTDIFIETFNQRGQYQTPDGWKDPERRREVIKVEGKADVSVEVQVTRHGPIITELLPGETRKLALRWTLYDPAALDIPFFAINSAQNWEEFRAAFSRFGSPAQNVVYADVDGHIGYQATGRIPIRAAGDGSIPAPGHDDTHAWTGYVPYDELPRVLDPPSGILATANGRIVPDGYKHVLTRQWASPHRTARIYQVLESGRKFSAADMLALQTDVQSDWDRFCAQQFAEAIERSPGASPHARKAAILLRSWDGRMAVESEAAVIVSRARRLLTRLLYEPKLGDAFNSYRWFMSSVALEKILREQPARWLPPGFDGYDELLLASVEGKGGDGKPLPEQDVPLPVTETAGKKPRQRWGDELPVQVQHPIFGRVPLLRRWTGTGRLPQAGNGYTVKQVGRTFGPSQRFTADLSNLDASTLNILSGQSGQIFSPHYMDQWSAWYGGTTFPLAFSSEAVTRTGRHQLVLEPK